ncbi:MAG: ribbon-helix-helix protein, CopG family [Acidimicrobiaceae bacterium]|nr:ribbon-helix-helix domain-containing protein [Acidimicrobiaceae bacterium]MXW62510.1 ribbon-helix-helix protein, CopG family [Acidimicrobiaceae bacterium]MXW75737.1 ribbon-helix-helix protein, CopG family [Acidimicrobiaceae bacterium]MYC43044.1 ribbon-helix-helix protein, CopG family [Acidimicrobiaceae bacterium]MYD07337.1 ribbon-helix-helix protein, CopG family [Acidimicrobiaceae bacterium]
MIRTQISLTEAQAVRLRTRAAAKGVSQAEFFRQALDAYFANDELALRVERARSAVGAHRSGSRSTAEYHDDALDEAFSA